MSRWAKGEHRCLRIVGVGKPFATGTGTRVGVALVRTEWLGWCDAVWRYLRCSGAIPSHRCAYGAPSARRHRCPWHQIADRHCGLSPEAVPGLGYVRKKRPGNVVRYQALVGECYSLGVAVGVDGVAEGLEDVLPFLRVAFEQGEAEARVAALEAREGHDDDARGAHEVVDEAFVWRDALDQLLDARFNSGIVDFKGLLVIEDVFLEHDGEVEGPAGFVGDDVFAAFEGVRGFIGPVVKHGCPGRQVGRVAFVAENAGDGHLGQGGGAHFQALGGQETFHVGGEVGVLTPIQHFEPAAAGAGPGVFLADAAHRYGGYILNPFAGVESGIAFIDDMGVNLVGNDEEIEFLGDFHDLVEDFPGIYGTRRVVRREDEDTGDGVVVLDLHADIVYIGEPAIERVELIGQMGIAGVGRLGGGVGAVGGGGPQNAGFPLQEPVHARDGIADAIKEEEVIGRDLDATIPFIDLGGQKFAGLDNAGRVAIAVARGFFQESLEDFLDPGGEGLAFFDGVTDVFPDDFAA